MTEMRIKCTDTGALPNFTLRKVYAVYDEDKVLDDAGHEVVVRYGDRKFTCGAATFRLHYIDDDRRDEYGHF